jgi:hypothetical protein
VLSSATATSARREGNVGMVCAILLEVDEAYALLRIAVHIAVATPPPRRRAVLHYTVL